jgi:malic enzyme/predicted methyltransferase MtxX (methanogen marker protein 4)
MSDTEKKTFTDEEALNFHRYPTPGKIGVVATKPMATQRDLSLAYSPGVAVPVHAIAKDPDAAYDYTSKGNLVAVISNGTAILGLGDLGALASKPVMEGKSVLFKRFGDVDSIDIEISSKDADEIITVVKNIGVTFGGINLEDIKSPECFRIETELQELLDIPVFHDDQHGTAIICAAGLINACHITGKQIQDVKVVLNGPGAAGIASMELIKAMGVKPETVIAVDSKGVLYQGRSEGMNQWKSAHAVDTPLRTLAEAVAGADVLLGLSAKGAFTPEMIASMAPNPVNFAMANPKRIVFAEGEDPSVIRAAYAYQTGGYGKAILCGRENLVRENMQVVGLDPDTVELEIHNARLSDRNPDYVDALYKRLQRQGFLKRDVQRLINQDRNSFAASMVVMGEADGMVTGVTRSFDQALEEVLRVVDPAPGGRIMGMSVVLAKGRTVFVADTNVTELPEAEELVEIACEAARAVKRLGFKPRVAFMSYSTFGNPMGERSEKVREAVAMLDEMDVDFEYEGEMPPELALDPEKRANYPFMRLTDSANILVMPAIHSASIATKLVQSLGGATVIGPVLLGLSKSVQIAPLSASVSKILNMAMMAAYEGSGDAGAAE